MTWREKFKYWISNLITPVWQFVRNITIFYWRHGIRRGHWKLWAISSCMIIEHWYHKGNIFNHSQPHLFANNSYPEFFVIVSTRLRQFETVAIELSNTSYGSRWHSAYLQRIDKFYRRWLPIKKWHLHFFIRCQGPDVCHGGSCVFGWQHHRRVCGFHD